MRRWPGVCTLGVVFRFFHFYAPLATGLLSQAFAQNSASVPAATIKAGDLSVEYRVSYGDAGAGQDDPFTQRIHVNYAPGDSVRFMAFIEQRKSGDGPLETRRISPNIFTQHVRTKHWDLGVRWQGDIPLQDGLPGRVRLGLLNNWRLGEFDLRSNVYLGKEIGENARDGLVFETREEVGLRVTPKLAFGALVFNNFVTTKNFGDFNAQRHQAGPFVRTTLGKRVRLEASALFGFSEAATDVEGRAFLGYSF